MHLSRIHRLLKLIGLLQGGRGLNIDGLAAECGVSRRTLFRDLDVLRDSGVPLCYDDEQQRYGIPGTYFLPPTEFTPEEALALIVVCHELGDEVGLPFFAPARSAALKLESNLPRRIREHLRLVAHAVRIYPPPRNPLAEKQPVYEQLLESIASHRSVRIRYRSLAERAEISTRLDPYRLLFSRRSWYVIGRSSMHRSVRTFNVGRIESLEPLEEPYRIPIGFSIERFLRNAWHLIPEPGPDQEVLVRFTPMVAQNVAEVMWHKTQRTQLNADGSLDYRVTVSGLGEISWWILGYGDQAEVIEPPALRTMIAQRATRLAERYARA